LLVSSELAVIRIMFSKENFGRINLWSWIDYDRVVYIDADCLVVGSLEPLIMLPAPMVGAVGAPAEPHLPAPGRLG
jgi:alpha-N-acetylglucosamine transferase